jgi:hypothetical protein
LKSEIIIIIRVIKKQNNELINCCNIDLNLNLIFDLFNNAAREIFLQEQKKLNSMELVSFKFKVQDFIKQSLFKINYKIKLRLLNIL